MARWRTPDLATSDLPALIEQLVDELAVAIERADPTTRSSSPAGHDHRAASRTIAFQVLSGWLRSNRRHLSDPAQADKVVGLISAVFHTPDAADVEFEIDVSSASTAAERLAVELGDDFTMVIVWVAAGLAAQFG